ncbi:MAG: phage tail length tape measure family protein [Magnetococcales bacterium]|nr:phage tail length tape measure family protein [Magnetococcales bacterium]
MGSETQLAIRLRADGAGQVASALESTATTLRNVAGAGDQAASAVREIGVAANMTASALASSISDTSAQSLANITSAAARTREAVGGIGGAAEISAGQMMMARRIVVSNLVNMGQAAIVTRGNLIATLSPLPDILYGISQMGAGAAASARNLLLFGGAFVTVAGGMAAVIAHAVTLESRTRQMNVSIKAMGDAAGITGEQLRKLSEAAATKGPFSRAESADAAKALVAGHPLIAGNMIGKLLSTSVDFSAAFGKDLTSGVNTLAGALEKGYVGIKQLDEQLNFLTRDELNQIETLGLMGKQTEAMGVALEALNRRFSGLAKEGMSESAKAMHELSGAWSEMMDKLAKSDMITTILKNTASFFSSVVHPPQLPSVIHDSVRDDPISDPAEPPPLPENGKAVQDRASKKIEELQKQLAREAQVLSVSAQNRPIEQARVDAKAYANENNIGLDQVESLMTGAAYKRIAASARDATDELRRNADAQGRMADAAAISDIAMRQAAVDNDIARFAVEKHGFQLQAYTEQARRAFENEGRARRAQWAREINDQASAANRLSEAFKSHSVAAIDAAERENQIQEAIRRLGVTAEEAALQIDKLFAHKWDQTAVQINRSADYLTNYRMSMEELNKAKETGILTDRAYAEQSRRTELEMLESSREWSDGWRRAHMKYTDDAGNAAKQAEQLFNKSTQSIADGLVDMATASDRSFKGMLKSFGNMAQGMLKEWLNMTIRAGMASQFGGGFGAGLFGALGSLFGGGAGGGAAIGMDATAGIIVHGGGIAGESGLPMRQVPSSVFTRAPRLHGGGLASDEVPAILQREEGVFTASQMRRLAPVGAGGNGGGGPVNINFTVQALDARGVSSAIYEHRALITGLVMQALERTGQKGRMSR